MLFDETGTPTDAKVRIGMIVAVEDDGIPVVCLVRVTLRSVGLVDAPLVTQNVERSVRRLLPMTIE